MQFGWNFYVKQSGTLSAPGSFCIFKANSNNNATKYIYMLYISPVCQLSSIKLTYENYACITLHILEN